MIKSLLKKINNLTSIINSLFYQIKSQLLFILFYKHKKNIYSETKSLKNNGYIHLKKKIPVQVINNFLKNYETSILEQKKINLNDYKFDIEIEVDDANIFFNYLKQNNILEICKDYLGKIGVLNAKINFQNENDCETSSMQPHHDTRGNDLKIYIWLSDYNINCHPLYYLKGSNNNFKLFTKYNHHRRKDISKDKMEKIFGDKGDVVIFDTHGWHSHIKQNTSERVVLEITILPENFLFKSFEKSNSHLNNLLQ